MYLLIDGYEIDQEGDDLEIKIDRKAARWDKKYWAKGVIKFQKYKSTRELKQTKLEEYDAVDKLFMQEREEVT